MELYRGIEYCKLHDDFLKSCLNNLNCSVFNIKKKYSRTISNLLSSWMFTLYSNYNFNDDPFFPTNYKYFDNNNAPSTAALPPPTTATEDLFLYKGASQVEQYEIPLPVQESSFSKPNFLLSLPIPNIKDIDSICVPSSKVE